MDTVPKKLMMMIIIAATSTTAPPRWPSFMKRIVYLHKIFTHLHRCAVHHLFTLYNTRSLFSLSHSQQQPSITSSREPAKPKILQSSQLLPFSLPSSPTHRPSCRDLTLNACCCCCCCYLAVFSPNLRSLLRHFSCCCFSLIVLHCAYVQVR